MKKHHVYDSAKRTGTLLLWLSCACSCFHSAWLLAQTAQPAVPEVEIPEGPELQKQASEASPLPGRQEQSPPGAAALPEGRELVNMDFAELTDIKDIIKAVSLWTGKNVILDRNVNGKVQIISPQKVTKEEAYQAFLSALNMLNLTTVETGKVIKVMSIRNAVKDNLKAYLGSSWAPRTDEIITQIIPLKYIDAKQVQTTLARIVSPNSMIAYEPTNTLIISESGYKIRRVLEILELLDVQTQQPKLLIVPIRYSDPKSIADKINEILAAGRGSKSSKSSPYHSFKILTDDRSNSVIIFGPPRTIQDIKELVKKFDIPLDDPTTQASIHVRPLDYADAKKLATTLSSLTSSKSNQRSGLRAPPIRKNSLSGDNTSGAASVANLGEGVKITADEASNSLLITGSRSAYDALNEIIRKLDLRRSQVFIEADILDINETNGFNFQTSLFAGTGNKDGSGTKSILGWEGASLAPLIAAQTQSDGTTSTTSAEKVAGAFASNMSIGILSGHEVQVKGLGTFSPGALMNLIKTDGNSRSIASPHILTSNNEQASISVGQKLFFNTSKVNPTTGVPIPSVEKEDVDMTLTVKPNISHSNYITMQIDLQANSPGPLSSEGLPSVSKRKTTQNVTVRNGQTIVISGLKETRMREAFKKIPLLGDLPLLGWFFRSSTLNAETNSLVVFLRPHIIHGANDLARIYKEKMSELNEFMEKVYGKGSEQKDFSSKLPSFDEGVYRATPVDKAEERIREENKRAALEAIGYMKEKKRRTTPSARSARSADKQETELVVPFPAPAGNDSGSSASPAADSTDGNQDNINPDEDLYTEPASEAGDSP